MIKNIKIRVLTLGAFVALIFGMSITYGQIQGRGDIQYTQNITVPGAQQATQVENQALISTIIQDAINRILGILALIALIILLYAGFLMLTAAGDEERYNKGFKILKYVAIGLIFIGLARFMVSMIFFLIDIFTP